MKSHAELSTADQQQLRQTYLDIEKVDTADIYSRQLNAASQMVFAVKRGGALKMDTNSDGKISPEEFYNQLKASLVRVSHIEKMKILQDVKPLIVKLISFFDTNKDGKLSKKEYHGATPSDDADRTFAFMDADKSGELDPEEMFLLPFPEFHPDETQYAKLLAEGPAVLFTGCATTMS